MRIALLVVALVLFVLGQVVVSVIVAVIAIGLAPSGKRVDGKARTGGLLGGVWDSVAAPSKRCASCRVDIPKAAKRCPHCTSTT